MKTILTSFDFMQNFDFFLTYKIYQNRARDGALALKHCVQLPYLWFMLQLSTAHQFGVAAHTPVSSPVF